MQQIALFVLFAWMPITIGLFTMVPARKAAALSLVGGWILLPPISIPLSGIPDYSKYTAGSYGILISTMLFEFPRIARLRAKWFDLPVVIFCASNFASALSNNFTAYEGMSLTLVTLFLWGIPYLIGRIYFGDLEGLQVLAIWVVIGGIISIPLCMFEILLGPTLAYRLYGIYRDTGGMRLGGYRPMLFFVHGLELGLWMSAATFAGWWLWRAGVLKKLFDMPFGTVLFPTLFVTNLLCKSSGALALLILGMASLWGSVRFKTRALLLGIVLLTPTYYSVRITGYWAGQGLLEFLSTWFDAERSTSVDFRLRNETVLVEKAMERPLLGWGGYGRALEVDVAKLVALNIRVADHAIPDGLWIITLGQTGLIGLISMTLIILLPPLLFMSRFRPADWLDPQVAASAMFAVLLSLYMLDCLANAMINLIYVVAMGGLSTVVPSRKRFEPSKPVLAFPDLSISVDHNLKALTAPPDITPKDTAAASLANRYADLGRSLANEGRWIEAKSTWFQAFDLWTRLTSSQPDNPRFASSWCDCCNDIAWFLLNGPAADPHDLSQAVSLANKATQSFPKQSTYWNTLGAAYCRSGDFHSGLNALHRSLALQHDQGTGFDYLYLALACSRLDQQDIARSWYEQGMAWTNAHAPDHKQLRQLGDEVKASLTPLE